MGKEKLDSEDAKNILTQYIGNITRTALRYVRDDIKDPNKYLLKQIEICNDIIELLKEKLKDDEFEELKISESAEVLTYVYSRMNNTSFNNEVIRYIESKGRVSLFVREYKSVDGKASPYIYLGECTHVSHEGNKLVSFVWKLKNAIPGKFISEANKNVL